MYRVQMSLQRFEKFCEIPPGNSELAEFMLEDLVGCSLLDLFATVIINEVSFHPVPGTPAEQQSCRVQIRAYCVSNRFPLSASESEYLELVLEDRVSCQALAQKGRDVTCLCEEGLVKGSLTSQSERRTFTFDSEQGGSLCNTIAYLLHDECGRRVDMLACVS